MKYFWIKKIILLIALLELAHLKMVSERIKLSKVDEQLQTLSESLQKISKRSAKITKKTSRKLGLEIASNVGEDQNSKEQKPNKLIFLPEDLISNLEDFGHKAWESANELTNLIEISKKNLKGSSQESLKVTQEEITKIKQSINFVKNANSALKYFIDHYILTEEVLKKYEEWVVKKPGRVSSTKGILSFMIHEFKNITLRKHDREFLKKPKCTIQYCLKSSLRFSFCQLQTNTCILFR
jgi:uncharacterized protein YoxC